MSEMIIGQITDSKNEILNMCLDLNVFYSSAMENMAILTAYSKMEKAIIKCDGNVQKLIGDSVRLLEQQLFIEVSKIYDSEGSRKNRNVTIKRLRMLIRKEYEKDDILVNEIIQQLDELCEYYSNTEIREMRNKTLAHHDKGELDKKRIRIVPYPMIEKLVLEGEKLSRKIIMSLFNINYSYNDYSEMVLGYTKAIRIMTGK